MATQTRTIRSVALPTEHGGWGFLAEPILPGLLVAPSWAGLLLSLAALAVFLDRLFEGRELDREWENADREVIPKGVGKRVVEVGSEDAGDAPESEDTGE